MQEILILVSLLLLVSCDGLYDHGPLSGGSGPSEFVSNGERIYFTGSSTSGSPISAVGGDGHINIHMRVHGSGCVTCHGVDRRLLASGLEQLVATNTIMHPLNAVDVSDLIAPAILDCIEQTGEVSA